MKTTKIILTLALIFFAFTFQSCQKDDTQPNQQSDNIIPERFTVDIPSSISSAAYYKDSNVDTLQGNDIYQHTRSFIHVGEHAAHIVGEIILVIGFHNLSQAMSFTFTSDDDGREKYVEIVENVNFEGHSWEYKMTITDVGSNESASNGNIAMQIFWDKNPIKGITLVNPYNLDRTTAPEYAETMYRIDYSEQKEFGYARHMIVSIDGLPLEDLLVDQYSMSTLKMFVGKNGNVVSVFGNSEHPNAKFFNGETGFDWAFTAAGNDATNIGVVEVGLPSNELDASDRYTLLVENSIQNVFTNQIYEVWPWIDSTTVQSYLYNTEAPGFFDNGGFIQGGTAPSQQYNSLLNIIAGLTPYNPAEINELEILFD